ncbi:hypothetical protein HN858_00415 [Candidatus Falkowbacteria bacterium]|jgi:hypothetical protein|nr:hypothetical protein [Candidatus Falkowbacteria bacterium]MBT5503727.1 hypothetical protein [Candidatus Falkowbacteria bacterium]MBT6573793.1 hypothetical protein [Candidatus Falkowbacteria bacterium]MBT7348116.1 hypothetical protein [Candidatus Falkowbacteria bacterium]
MKKIAKSFAIASAIIIVLQIFGLVFFVLAPTVMAEDVEGGFTAIAPVTNVKLGTLDFNFATDLTPKTCTPQEGRNPEAKCIQIDWIAKYLSMAYKYAVTLGSLIAVLMLIAGGLMYVVSGFNQTLIAKAKSFMTGSVLGLVLLLGTYILLNTVNPNLVGLKPLEIEVVVGQVVARTGFCNEFDTTKFDVVDAVCGQMGSYEAKDKSMVDKGECMGSQCGGNQVCIPKDKKKPDPKQVACTDALVWGYLNYSSRYLSGLSLFSLQGHSDTDCIKGSVDHNVDTLVKCATSEAIAKVEDGDKMYVIKASEIGTLPSADNYVLGLEIHDTGVERSKELNSELATMFQKGLDKVGADFAIPDGYYAGIDLVESKAGGPNQAVWVEPCANAVGVMKKAAGGVGWELFGDQSPPGYKYFKPFTKHEMNNGGVRLDVTMSNFFEDKVIQCGSLGELKATKPMGADCGNDWECISNDCEGESGAGTTPGAQRCECNETSDCANEGMPDAICAKSLATWNSCVQPKSAGRFVFKDDVYVSGDYGGICDPTLFSHVTGQDDTQCFGPTTDCEGEENSDGVAQIRCECDSDADCSVHGTINGDAFVCAKTDGDGCGWNRCINGKLPDGWSCYNHKDCESGYCPSISGCDKCAPKAETCTKGKYLDSCEYGGDSACCPGFDCMSVYFGDGNQCEPENQSTCNQYYPGSNFVGQKVYPNKCEK